jgi:hypothetical protein
VLVASSLFSWGYYHSFFNSSYSSCQAFTPQQQRLASSSGRRRSESYRTSQLLKISNDSNMPDSDKLKDLKVAIAGAGPAGLFLAHLLLKQGSQVTIYEKRPDPRTNTRAALAGYAMLLALGCGDERPFERLMKICGAPSRHEGQNATDVDFIWDP